MIRSFIYTIQLCYIALVYFVLVQCCPKAKRPKRVVLMLRLLGPSFIKLGQTLSVRPDIVGERMADALSSLQDKMPPFSSRVAKKTIELALEKPIDQLFASFTEEAVAAASIAQVHSAITTEGQKVAVKVLRPRIKKAFQRDINLFHFIAHVANRFKQFKRLRLIEVVQAFERMVHKELDLRIEAACASQLKENCCDDEGFYVPKVDWERTSMNVLTIEWVEGTQIHDIARLVEKGHDLKTLSHNVLICFLNQSYRDGFFHADLHPAIYLWMIRGVLSRSISVLWGSWTLKPVFM